jgi:short-subunit dehydrogenase
MRHDLTGSRIVITGASSGIGLALARALAPCPTRLVLAARSAYELERLAADLRGTGAEALAVPTDLTDPGQRARLLDKALTAYGGIDILVNNAGVGASGFFARATEERLRQIFEVNFFAATELTCLALPHLARGRRPQIVNVSSVIGRRGVPGYAEYCASKFALCGWSEALRAELRSEGIHVLLVCPGLIATPFREHQLEDRLHKKWPTRRGMTAERCAALIVRAMRRRQSELVTTWDGKLLLWLNRLVPRLVDVGMNRYARGESD